MALINATTATGSALASSKSEPLMRHRSAYSSSDGGCSSLRIGRTASNETAAQIAVKINTDSADATWVRRTAANGPMAVPSVAASEKNPRPSLRRLGGIMSRTADVTAAEMTPNAVPCTTRKAINRTTWFANGQSTEHNTNTVSASTRVRFRPIKSRYLPITRRTSPAPTTKELAAKPAAVSLVLNRWAAYRAINVINAMNTM